MNIYINVFLVDIQLANGNAFFIFKKIGVIDIERGLVALDYFYGQAGELFSFYRIPKALFQEQRFQSLSTDAKTLYGILLDRMSLSVKNGWLETSRTGCSSSSRSRMSRGHCVAQTTKRPSCSGNLKSLG